LIRCLIYSKKFSSPVGILPQGLLRSFGALKAPSMGISHGDPYGTFGKRSPFVPAKGIPVEEGICRRHAYGTFGRRGVPDRREGEVVERNMIIQSDIFAERKYRTG